MKLNVEFENKNETSVETLDATRMELQELIDLLDKVVEGIEETNLVPVVSVPVFSISPAQHNVEFSSESGNNFVSNFQTTDNTMVVLKRFAAEESLSNRKTHVNGIWERCERFIRLTLSGMYDRHIENLQKELMSKTAIVLASDGSWRKRRESPNFVYVIMEATNGLVIHLEILSKKTVRSIADSQNPGERRIIQIGESNYEGTSKGMEGYGFRKAMDTLEAKGILSKVKYLITDEDGPAFYLK